MSDQEHLHYREYFLEKYVLKKKYPIWENLNPALEYSIKQEFAWIHFDSLLKNKKIIVFFDIEDSPNALFLSNGADLKKCLEESYTFNFYVTDSELSFYFAYNDDHDVLSAGGEAINWLKNFQQTSI